MAVKDDDAILSAQQFRESFESQVYDRPFIGARRAESSPKKNLNLNDIRNSLHKYAGLQKSSLFIVTIANASTYLDQNFQDRDLIYFCNQASIPGYGLLTSNGYQRFGVGPVENIPYQVAFTDMNMTFLGDAEGHVHQFFEAWSNQIVNYSYAEDMAAAQLPYGESSTWQPGEVGYKKDFQREIIIETIDMSGNVINKFTLTKAYPVSMSSVGLSWERTDSYVEIPVSFNFLNWRSEKYSIDHAASANLPGIGLLQRVLQLGSIAATVATIKRPRNIADIINIVNKVNTIGQSVRK